MGFKLTLKLGGKRAESDGKNTQREIQSFGSNVIKGARKTLSKLGKSQGDLYSGMSYDFNDIDNGYEIDFDFGKAKNYWAFIDQGVRGKGGAGTGTGKVRGGKSPFSFKNKQPPSSALINWAKKKGIRGRNKQGRFITDKSLGFLLARSVFRRGVVRSLFFTSSFNQQFLTFEENIGKAVLEDFEDVWDDLPKTILEIKMDKLNMK